MWDVVRPQLSEYFNISFDKNGQPVCDEHFHNYVLELDDATKVLNDRTGRPVNFGSMPTETFLKVREYIDNDQLEKVLDL